ncbi:MAG: zinc dependent phospholipase C family protein [Saccharofermentanales bacterium]
MATWMIHFRITDYFINKYSVLNNESFIMGNIGPDCSIVDEFGNFTPSFNITHFTDTGRKLDMNIDSFYNKYIHDKDLDRNSFSFYLGYYIHLFTDFLWTKYIWLPVKEKHINEIISVNQFMNLVRQDWLAQDHIFYKKNPDFKVFEDFCSIKKFDNTYLDFYIFDTFTKRISDICGLYNNFKDDLDKEYLYFSENEADNFITICSDEIDEILIQKEIIGF